VRYVNNYNACIFAQGSAAMTALIALIEALASKIDALTAKLAALEMRIKTGECSCDTWRRHTGLPREKKD
jgi:prefoldin subunit 5